MPTSRRSRCVVRCSNSSDASAAFSSISSPSSAWTPPPVDCAVSSAPSQSCAVGGPQPVLADAIELVRLDTLTPYAGNPRVHDERQITKLVAMIRANGFLVPILVDDAGIIIAGHGRYEAARRLKLQAVPTIRAAHLSAKQVKALRLADNKIAQMSRWDERALAVELRDLVLEMDPEVLELTGFETAEIDLSLEVLGRGEAHDEADQVVSPAAHAVTRQNDCWQLGPHRLICGSALEPSTYEALLQGAVADAVWSDPPYNTPVAGHVSGLGRHTHREFAMASGEMSEQEFVVFLTAYLALAKQHSRPGALHYACMDGAHNLELLLAARQAGLSFKTTCTWAKTNAGMGSLYRQQTEFVHVFKHGGPEVPHTNTIQLGKHGRFRTTLWTYAGVNSFGRSRDQDLAAHPTVKPWVMVADAIKDCTHPGERVLDCFGGSGTTLIAAHKTHRIGYAIELDPVYVDVAVRRWQTLTGEDAHLLSTGQSFAMVAAERAGAHPTGKGSPEAPSVAQATEVSHD